MEIRQFAWDAVDSNSWLITEGNHGILIDAVENEALLKEIRSLASLSVILTHCHFDHIVGLNRIRQARPDAKVISTALCSGHIGNKYRNMSSSASAFMTFYQGGRKKDARIESFVCEPADQTFEDRLEFSWEGHAVRLYAVYGHSPDGLVAMVDRFLFSGDTILRTPTVTRLPRGSRERYLSEDIPLLKGLDAEKIFPGHGQVMDGRTTHAETGAHDQLL